MRKIPAVIKQLLLRDDTDFVYLVKIQVADGTVLLDTNCPYAVTIGGDTFVPNSGLQQVEPPRLSTTVDREAYKITYIDPDHSKLALFEKGLTGAKVTVWAAFINTTGVPLSATGGVFNDGEILVNDLLIAYRGIVDTQGYTINPSNGTIVAVVECASPMAGLSVVKSLYNSDASLKERNPADTAFVQINENASKVALLWGKKEV